MQLYLVLSQDSLYSDPNKNFIFMENHDTERYFTTVGENKEHFKIAYAYLMTTRGIPQVYNRSELMFPMDKVRGDGLGARICWKDFPSMNAVCSQQVAEPICEMKPMTTRAR